MRLNQLPKIALIANWVLACALLASVVSSLLLTRESAWLGGALSFLNLVLLAGVLLRIAFAYVGVVTFALLGMAGALNREDLLNAAIAAVILGVALYIRSRLQSSRLDAPSHTHIEDPRGGA
jgi:hypothetical protein